MVLVVDSGTISNDTYVEEELKDHYMSIANKPQVLWQKILYLCLVVLFFTGADLWVKEVVQRKLKYKPDVVVISGFWSFHYTENDDIGFSFLRFLNSMLSPKQKFILIVGLQLAGTCAALVIFFYLKHWKYSIPLAFIISGGLGNVLDRIIRGYVVDYVKWYVGSFIWPIFNLADVYTVIGTSFLALILLLFSKEVKEKDPNLKD